MTTLRGSFCALHRLVERKLRQLCTALGHPRPLHTAALRTVQHPTARHAVGEASVTGTHTSTHAAGEPSTAAEEVDRAPFGFEVPAADSTADMLRQAARRGEQERAIIDVRDETHGGGGIRQCGSRSSALCGAESARLPSSSPSCL